MTCIIYKSCLRGINYSIVEIYNCCNVRTERLSFQKSFKLRIGFRAKLLMVCALVCTITLSGVFIYLDNRQQSIYLDFMKNQSRAIFKQIVITRKWIADHGGIFVEKLPWSSPNPYLDNSAVTTADGRRYIKENPAMVTRELSEYAKEHGSYWFHITSLNLVNPSNAPDGFEEKALRSFDAGEKSEAWTVSTINNERYFRYIAPLYIEESCLNCHSRHGYELGDVRGAISVSIPVEAFYIFLKRERIVMAFFTLSVALLLMIGLYIALNRVLVFPIKQLRDFALAWREGTLDKNIPDFREPLRPEALGEGDELDDLYKELRNLHVAVTSHERDLEEKIRYATGELKTMNERLAQARDRYRDTSLKKSEFIAGLSHELRTPLTSVKGAVGYITGRVLDGEVSESELTPFVDIINRNIGRLVKLVEDTLDLEKIEAGHIELHLSRVDMGKLFEEVSEEYEQTAREKQVSLKIEAEGQLMVTVDRDRIRQVLDNLVLNAIKYSPAGAVITIAGRIGNDEVITEIRDEGPGIPPQSQRRVFDRFYKGAKEGSGLGLTISRGIVESHGGNIWVESDGKRGSTFIFSLPQHIAEPAEERSVQGV